MSSFTPSQRRAIEANGNVLVVAGAGTGKTSALVERCLTRLLHPRDPTSLDEILMVTFTEAAATEMRQRIRKRLTEALQGRPSDQRLEEQLALLDTAHISTLHSFCLELVRQHFHELGLDPLITVLDEHQTRPMELAVLEAIFQKYYAGDTALDRAVHTLIRECGHGSDETIRRLVLKLHRFTQALAHPAQWLSRQIARFSQPEPLQWRDWLTQGFSEWRELWLSALKLHGQTPNVASCIAAISGHAAQTSWPEIRDAIQAICDAEHSQWPQGAKGRVRDQIIDFFEDARFLHSLLTADGGKDPLAEDWQYVRQPMLLLLELTREFTAEFTRAKREMGGVDFADLEQLALALLRDPSTRGATQAAQTWQQKFRYVFVDEYQDINEAQDAILTLLSRAESRGNRFLVGDVKQSIYRFRLANPRIFRAYERRWNEASTEGVGVSLSDNFRSREALLEFVNLLFKTLMRSAIGGVDYQDKAELRFANRDGRVHLSLEGTQPGKNNPLSPRVEFLLLPKPGSDAGLDDSSDESEHGADRADLDAVEKEAQLVAQRLRRLHEEQHQVWDETKQAFRAVEWRDMVTLMRSVESRAERFAKEFSRAGVPLLAPRAGFYSALEVLDLLNLLRLLDNPLQDVPLLAVLRSPLVGLSVTELAQIRVRSSARPFWAALRRALDRSVVSGQSSVSAAQTSMTDDSGELPAETQAKIDSFLKSFERWRRIIRQSSLSHCLETVLTETHYEAILLAEERGPERLANVRRLLDLARQYDPYQRQGLFRFLRFIETQEEAELDREPAAASAENAVRLMTIHKSKGLEFPVVVVAGLGARFNVKELNEDILIDEDLGLCPKVKLPGSDQVYPSLPHWLAANRARREFLGEEMRLLYVALTRARDTLILVGTARRKDDAQRGEPAMGKVVTDRDILTGRSFLDWLLLCLPMVMRTEDWSNEHEGQSRLLRWKIYSDDELSSFAMAPKSPEPEANEPTDDRCDEYPLATLKQRLSWQYPYRPLTTEPAKTSVSELRRRLRDETEEEAERPFEFQVSRFTFQLGLGPLPSAVALSAAEIGTAHHVFLQLMSLERTGTLPNLMAEATRLLKAGILSALEIAALDFDAMLHFWQGEVGQKILGQRARVHRELPFTTRFALGELKEFGERAVPRATLSAENSNTLSDRGVATVQDEFVVLQGVVDLAVVLPAEVWLLDFKTDELSPASLRKKTDLYRPQLALYARALSRIYRRPTTNCWLHFLRVGETVGLD